MPGDRVSTTLQTGCKYQHFLFLFKSLMFGVSQPIRRAKNEYKLGLIVGCLPSSYAVQTIRQLLPAFRRWYKQN